MHEECDTVTLESHIRSFIHMNLEYIYICLHAHTCMSCVCVHQLSKSMCVGYTSAKMTEQKVHKRLNRLFLHTYTHNVQARKPNE